MYNEALVHLFSFVFQAKINIFWSEWGVCAALGLQAERRWPLLKVFLSLSFFLSLWALCFSPRRGCPRVLKFCMGSWGALGDIKPPKIRGPPALAPCGAILFVSSSKVAVGYRNFE